jgi:hypothetical protein
MLRHRVQVRIDDTLQARTIARTPGGLQCGDRNRNYQKRSQDHLTLLFTIADYDKLQW